MKNDFFRRDVCLKKKHGEVNSAHHFFLTPKKITCFFFAHEIHSLLQLQHIQRDSTWRISVREPADSGHPNSTPSSKTWLPVSQVSRCLKFPSCESFHPALSVLMLGKTLDVFCIFLWNLVPEHLRWCSFKVGCIRNGFNS